MKPDQRRHIFFWTGLPLCVILAVSAGICYGLQATFWLGDILMVCAVITLLTVCIVTGRHHTNQPGNKQTPLDPTAIPPLSLEGSSAASGLGETTHIKTNKNHPLSMLPLSMFPPKTGAIATTKTPQPKPQILSAKQLQHAHLLRSVHSDFKTPKSEVRQMDGEHPNRSNHYPSKARSLLRNKLASSDSTYEDRSNKSNDSAPSSTKSTSRTPLQSMTPTQNGRTIGSNANMESTFINAITRRTSRQIEDYLTHSRTPNSTIFNQRTPCMIANNNDSFIGSTGNKEPASIIGIIMPPTKTFAAYINH